MSCLKTFLVNVISNSAEVRKSTLLETEFGCGRSLMRKLDFFSCDIYNIYYYSVPWMLCKVRRQTSVNACAYESKSG